MIMDDKTLRALAATDRRAKAHSKAAHEALVDAIWEAADTGWLQARIVQATRLSRERIRQLCDSEYRERTLERRKREQQQ